MKVKSMLIISSIFVAAAIADAQSLEHQIQSAAEAHNVDEQLLKAIVAVESQGRLAAYNKRTHDYGLGQINKRTAAAYGFNRAKLLTDAQYNLNAAATVLAYFQKRYKAKEPHTWYCRYNVGTRSNAHKTQACTAYLIKVQSKLKATNVAKEY